MKRECWCTRREQTGAHEEGILLHKNGADSCKIIGNAGAQEESRLVHMNRECWCTSREQTGSQEEEMLVRMRRADWCTIRGNADAYEENRLV